MEGRRSERRGHWLRILERWATRLTFAEHLDQMTEFFID